MKAAWKNFIFFFFIWFGIFITATIYAKADGYLEHIFYSFPLICMCMIYRHAKEFKDEEPKK